eukprot:TRINITY_DN5975_c1_g2_i1.p1 TRINITY_DN5975_c1_g2~~TRINITY_DN5975_c1_g2_i1.p1  ORF type:complete len:254 (+),score=52.42 TRINITY_DN5975_c1_g2_i1:48-764(+)
MACAKRFVACVAAATLVVATSPIAEGEARVVPQFNSTKCPAPWELQAPEVAKSFALQDLEGFFYELGFHDYTQYPLCPFSPKCITSSKKIQKHADGKLFVNDTWNINCAGAPYPQELLFNVTDKVGYLEGYWPAAKIPFLPKGIAANLVFPDTVVDFKSGPEGWVIEMQCVEWLHHVAFVGINFYAKVKGDAVFKEMEAAARARGLGFYMDKGFGLRRVDFTDCPTNTEPRTKESIMV